MKYWLLTTEYPPEFGGGIGTYCFQWSKILKQNKVEITVFILTKQEKKFKEIVRDNIRRIEFSPYLKNTFDFFGYETMVSSSFEEIVRLYVEKEGPPDWVEAQEYHGIAYFLLQKKHLGDELYKNLKVLITCHCPSFITFEHNHISIYQFPYFWIGEMELFCMRAADLCIFPSKYLANDILTRYPALIDKYAILYNPYLNTSNTVSDNKNHQGDTVIIGKLSPAKGILNALIVFDKLWQKGFNYKLRLVGDENYFYHAAGRTMGDYLKKKYSFYLGSGLLTITGTFSPDKVKNEILKARIVLVPSTVENLPYTVIEAMAAGAIVLASMQGGQNEIIQDSRNGFLFDYDNPSSFEEKLHTIYRLENDKINQIRNEAIKTIKRECDPQAYFTKKKELLNQNPVTTKTDFPFISLLTDRERIQNDETDNENNLLSIVIPYYNMGKYIHETIASIDASGYKNKEIIIINDGSRDEESQVLKSFKFRTDIRIIDQPNMGLPAARNRGGEEARGKYLAFLDADDKVAGDYYKKAIDILKQKSNVHFVGCWVQYFGGSNRKWPAFNPEPPLLLYHNTVNSSSLVYRKASFLKAGLNDSKFIYGMEDYNTVINLLKSGYHGVVIPEFLFFYRVRKDSMARKFNKSNQLYLYKLLAEKHSSFYATFAAELFGLLNANGPGIFLDNPSLDYHLTEKIPFAGNLSRKLIHMVKKNRFTRKMAYKIYQLFNR